MKLSVIIPVHNGSETLRQGLEALKAATRLPDEIIVVDDASTDNSGNVAQQAGARVLSLTGEARGPAYARNRGAEIAQGDVLVFLDADVAAHSDTLTRIEQTLEAHPEIAALFGSYDDDPPAPGLVSRFKNLLHHYVHQHGHREAVTFWTGCGAIRREVFLSLTGFDETYRMIEDIELGSRLHQTGRNVWLCPNIQVTHLKHWTLPSMLRSDICDRAIPWTQLMVREQHLPADLNVNLQGRLGAVLAWLFIFCLVLGFWWPFFWIGMLAAGAGLFTLNADLYRFFARHGGVGFAFGASGLHVLYLLYSSLVFVVIMVPAFLAQHGLALLLIVTLLKGLTWSILIPPWHAPDEQQHFLYGANIARQQTLQISPSLRVPQEAYQLFKLIQFYDVRYQGQPLKLNDRSQIATQIAQLREQKPRSTFYYDHKRQIVRIRTFPNYHPPLHYAALAGIQWMLADTSILVRWLACRWFSVALGVATVALAYGAGRLLWPQRQNRALLLGTLVSFQPMLTFTTSIINNSALEIALFSACLLVSLYTIRAGLDWQRGVLLGTLLGLGLLTKISFLSLVPLLGLLVVWQVLQSRANRRQWQAFLPWVAVALIPVALAGWWYADAIFSGGDTLLTSYAARPERPPVSLLPYLAHYGWITIYRMVLNMYWGNFGWLDTPLPGSLWLVLSWLTVIAAWTTGWRLIRQFAARRRRIEEQRRPFAVFFLGCATLFVIIFYTYLDYRSARDLGKRFGIQGRYYLSPIIGQMVWLMLGMREPVPVRLRRVWTWGTGAGMIALNLYALLRVILPRYYGSGTLLQMLERATVLQPISIHLLLMLSIAFVLTILAQLTALTREK